MKPYERLRESPSPPRNSIVYRFTDGNQIAGAATGCSEKISPWTSTMNGDIFIILFGFPVLHLLSEAEIFLRSIDVSERKKSGINS